MFFIVELFLIGKKIIWYSLEIWWFNVERNIKINDLIEIERKDPIEKILKNVSKYFQMKMKIKIKMNWII